MTVENTHDLDWLAEKLTSRLVKAYKVSCPIIRRKTKRTVPWWNTRFARLCEKLRRLSNASKHSVIERFSKLLLPSITKRSDALSVGLGVDFVLKLGTLKLRLVFAKCFLRTAQIELASLKTSSVTSQELGVIA